MRRHDERTAGDAASGRRDLALQLEELGQVKVGDERVALGTGAPEDDAESPDDPRVQARRKREPLARHDEERGRVEPALVDEDRRSPIEEGLHGTALQRELVVSGEAKGGREVELA